MTSPAHPKGANTAGWRVVPVEATAGMHLAACGNLGPYPSMTEKWNAMIAARPRPDYDAMAVEVLERFFECAPHANDVGYRLRMAAALRGYFEGE